VSPPVQPGIDTLREACWSETAVDLIYSDKDDVVTERRVWPLSIVFLENRQMLLAFCCLRQEMRRFYLHRIEAVSATDESFRPRRVPLLRAYFTELAGGGRTRDAG